MVHVDPFGRIGQGLVVREVRLSLVVGTNVVAFGCIVGFARAMHVATTAPRAER